MKPKLPTNPMDVHCHEVKCPDFELCSKLVTFGRPDMCTERHYEEDGKEFLHVYKVEGIGKNDFK